MLVRVRRASTIAIAPVIIMSAACGEEDGDGGDSSGGNAASSTGGSAGVSSGGSGGFCTPDMPCPCSGSTCDQPWQCVQGTRSCAGDRLPLCGCDGVTFTADRTCTDRPFLFVGNCEDGANCNSRQATCSVSAPECPQGQVASVFRSCWGRCVPIGTCACQSAEDCPDPNLDVCDPASRRCN